MRELVYSGEEVSGLVIHGNAHKSSEKLDSLVFSGSSDGVGTPGDDAWENQLHNPCALCSSNYDGQPYLAKVL